MSVSTLIFHAARPVQCKASNASISPFRKVLHEKNVRPIRNVEILEKLDHTSIQLARTGTYRIIYFLGLLKVHL